MKHALCCIRRAQLRRYGASKRALRLAMTELTEAREQVDEGLEYINALIEIIPSETFNDAVLAGKLNGIRAYIETGGTDNYQSIRAENERLTYYNHRLLEDASRLWRCCKCGAQFWQPRSEPIQCPAREAGTLELLSDYQRRTIDELTATVERMRGLLKRVEWCGIVRDSLHFPVPGCWFCEQPETDGHADDCELKRELA